MSSSVALMASGCGAGDTHVPRAAAVHKFGTSGSLVIAADGTIIAPTTPFGQFGVARYTRRGQLDSSFGVNGKTATDLHADRYGAGAAALAVQADQKIVAFGQSTRTAIQDPHECIGGGDPAVVRYLPDGIPDHRFGSGGTVLTKIEQFSSGLLAGAIEPSGKIVAVGSSVCGGFGKLQLLRFTRNGQLDRSFGNGGKVFNPRFAPAADIALQSDGKIVLAGSIQPNAAAGPVPTVLRYLPNGHPDAQFGTHGTAPYRFDTAGGALNALAIQPNRKIVAVGSIGGWLAVLRYSRNGRPDSGFGSHGEVVIGLAPHYGGDSASAVAVQADGKILVGGSYLVGPNDNSPNVLALVRFTRDGRPDPTFGKGGEIVDRHHRSVAGIAVLPIQPKVAMTAVSATRTPPRAVRPAQFSRVVLAKSELRVGSPAAFRIARRCASCAVFYSQGSGSRQGHACRREQAPRSTHLSSTLGNRQEPRATPERNSCDRPAVKLSPCAGGRGRRGPDWIPCRTTSRTA